MTRTLRLTAAALLLLGAPLAVVAFRLTRADSLPEPLPTHWGAGGELDGTSTLASFTTGVLVATALAALAGLALLALRARRPVVPEAVALVGWLGWLLAAVYAQVLLVADGATTAAEVALGWEWIAAVVLVPTALAAVLWWLLPPAAAGVPVLAPASALTLRPGERVVWVGGARSRVLLGLGLAMVPAGAALALAVTVEGVLLAATGVLLALLSSLTVRVDREAVTVRWGVLGLPRHRVPLATVGAAHVEDVEPLRWGGWGYRVSTRGRAAVVRRGPGLVLTLTDGRELAVTVDRPEGAAELVNALVATPGEARAEAH